MTLNISSEQLGRPMPAELLSQLNHTFSRIGKDFVVIGATARDIMLGLLTGASARRKTRDLDIAIAVADWNSFDMVSSALIADGFEKSQYHAQRFYFHNFEIDIVPYGPVASDNDIVYWPPEGTTAMSVRGYEDALAVPVTVRVDSIYDIKVASLQGLFILKLDAWHDRNLTTDKDAEDIWHIIDNYYLANEKRSIHPEVYDLEDFDLITGAAYWLGHDIAEMLDDKQRRYYGKLIRNEISAAESSRLISQILDTHRYLSPSAIVRALDIIAGILDK